MKSLLKKSWLFLLLAVLSFTIHFAFLNYPAQVVFDEVHFGKFVSAYFTGQYYFDIHPPLGKLMIAGWAKLTGVNPVFPPVPEPDGSVRGFTFDKIGEPIPADILFALRFLPAFFGALFVLAFSWLAYIISRSRAAALIAGFLILLDNAFLVQSRFILVDIFLLFFEILTFCFFFLQQRQKIYSAKWFLYLLITGIFFGLTISVKWTGLATIGILGVILITKIFNKRLTNYLKNGVIASDAALAGKRGNPAAGDNNSGLPADKQTDFITPINIGTPRHNKAKEFFIGLLLLLLIGFAIYLLPFAVHFKLLPHSGPGDAFMSQTFQRELKYGRENIYQPLTFFQKFIELNKTMLSANANITAQHPYGSRWYNWPRDNKPIYYWNSEKPLAGKTANIYFVGNPILWWLVLCSVVATIILTATKNRPKPIFYILLLAYLTNLLPFIFIKRVSFLYHYLPAAAFGILLTALYLERIRKQKKVFWTICALVTVGFVILIPYSYGLIIPSWLNKLESIIISSLI